MYEDNFIGEIRMFTGDFVPRGWALCDGSRYSVDQNTALFSLLGYVYGDIRPTSFTLPDLRSRVPIHSGIGNNLSIPYKVGNYVGTETVAVSVPDFKAIPPRYKAKSPTQFKAMSANQSLIQPVLTVNFIIALKGAFPVRSGLKVI